jgi:tetratricopeptide (TPR) repeat protein
VEEGANIKGKGGDGNIQHPTSNIQHPTQGITHHASRITHHVSPYYCLALLFFACGLMSKPMVVTLPFVLLLIDFWPLGRFSGFTRRRGASARQEFQVSSSEKASTLNPVKGRGPHGALHTQPSTESAARLLLEKLPFFALAAAGSLVTYLVQKSGGAVWSSPNLPFSFRLANALMSYLRYISKTFWPADLAFIYPYPHHWSLVLVMGAALLLAAWSVLFVLTARRYPYLAVGWLWYLGTLVPAIGLVQVGVQSMADRYLYIPSLGLFILIVWGLNDFLSSQPQKQRLAAVIGAAALSGCLIGTWFQLKHWENSVKLFSHAIKVTTDNYAAYDCLGEVLEQLGRKDEAAALYAESVRIEPGYPIGQFKLGMILLESGRPEDAFTHLKAAADLMPRNPDLQYDLGVFLSQHGKPDEAISRLNAALGLRPDFPEALNQLAWILSTNPDPKLRSGQKAVPLAERACELTQNRLPAFLTTLSVAYAEAGRFSDAITTAQKARDLAVASGQKEIAARDEALLKLYESHQPFRETN